MLKPQRLRSGDKVAVVAPASPFPREEFDKGVAEIRSASASSPCSTTASSHRAAVPVAATARCAPTRFFDAWRDPSIRALIAVRGGYGSVHLLPYLKSDDLRHDAESLHWVQRSHIRC